MSQASFDKWLEEGGDYDKNHSVNIYSEGFLVSWLLDFSIIEKTKLEKSYRDVHNALYQQFKIPKSFDETDLVNILKQVTGDDYQAWWQENVHGYANVDFNKLLAKAGLTMNYAQKNKQRAWTGIKTKPSTNGLKISAIEKGSPAWNAGLMLDDIIIAIDDLRISDKDLGKRLKNFKPKDQVNITFFRRDELFTRMITLGATPQGKLNIVPIKNASRKQKAFFKHWTGIAFPH